MNIWIGVVYLALLVSCGAPRPSLDSPLMAKRMEHTASVASMDLASASEVESQGMGGGQSFTQTAQRKVHYQAGVQLKATHPLRVLDSAVAQANHLGGYVVERSSQLARIHVPVASFRAYFEWVQGLGVLQGQWLRADDITLAYQDNALRIRIHESMLERLHQLLASSTQDEEKLQLLREIQRVSDEWVRLKNMQNLMETQSQMSLLELHVTPFEMGSMRQNAGIGAFQWFTQLNPVRVEEPLMGKPLTLQVPHGFVKLDLKKRWASRSADGVEYWAFRRLNEPLGDGAFWQKALEHSLGQDFAQVDRFVEGPFSVIRLESHGPDVFVWWIAVATDQKRLYVTEVFFPDSLAEKRHGAAIRQSLQGGVL